MHAGFFLERPVGTRPVENPIRGCEDNIKMVLDKLEGKA
jgi:hypothetical protein